MKLFVYRNRFWFLLLIAGVVIFYSYSYGDVFITTVHGINFWDCLFSGNIRQFYQYNLHAQLEAGVYHQADIAAYYDFLIYVIFALWDFPLWIIGKLANINALNTLVGCMWAKSIVLFFYLLVCLEVIKICRLLEDDKKIIDIIKFVLFTSPFAVVYIGVLGQYDVITLFFMLLGIRYLMQNRFAGFMLCFIVAIQVKSFSLLLFVALILYTQKNILKVFLGLIGGVVPVFCIRKLVPFASASNAESFMNFLFQNQRTYSVGNASIFVIAIVIFYLSVYFLKTGEEAQKKKIDIIKISFVCYAIFAITCFTLPYWCMYLAPFYALVCVIKRKNLFLNIILETLGEAAMIIVQMYTFFWCFGGVIMDNMIFKGLLPKEVSDDMTFPNFLTKVFGEERASVVGSLIQPIGLGIFIATVVLFIVINYFHLNFEKQLIEEERQVKLVLGMRCVAAVALVLIPAVYRCL